MAKYFQDQIGDASTGNAPAAAPRAEVMSTQVTKPPAATEEEIVCQVSLKGAGSDTAQWQKYQGKCEMIATREGIKFHKYKGLGRKKTLLQRSWMDTREVTSQLTDKGWFAADVGAGKKHMTFQVKVREGDTASLQDLLCSLPPAAYLKRCPHCGGPFSDADDLCPACGKSISAGYRKQGLIAIGVGAALAIGGIVISIVSYEGARGGGTYFVYYGPVVFGVISIFAGILKLIRGKR